MINSPEYLRHDATKRCAICDRKFGLVRHYSWNSAVCSKKCVSRLTARRLDHFRWLFRAEFVR
jgi:hypothetical protein